MIWVGQQLGIDLGNLEATDESFSLALRSTKFHYHKMSALKVINNGIWDAELIV